MPEGTDTALCATDDESGLCDWCANPLEIQAPAIAAHATPHSMAATNNLFKNRRGLIGMRNGIRHSSWFMSVRTHYHNGVSWVGVLSVLLTHFGVYSTRVGFAQNGECCC